MHIKWLKHGAGDARKATAYVLASHDHQGIRRAGVEVLRGNPAQVAEVANSLSFSKKYSSGVIAWANEDAPTKEQIEQTLDEFAAVAFAGLDADRIAWTAVQHIEQDGSTHVHILVARSDLYTGKAFNPAPPGWEKSYDPLRDALNYENGWARPDDPARSRLVQPGHQALIDAATLRKGLTTPTNAKEQITAWLTSRIEAGLITDRASLAASLSELGEVTRQGKDYISVKPEGFDKPLRLKGAIYVEDFQSDKLVGGNTKESRGGSGGDHAANQRAAAAARRDLEAAIQRRTDFNSKRYQRTTGASIEEPGIEQKPDQTPGKVAEAGSAKSNSAPHVGTENPAFAIHPILPPDLRRDLGLLEPGEPVRDHNHAERCRGRPETGSNVTT